MPGVSILANQMNDSDTRLEPAKPRLYVHSTMAAALAMDWPGFEVCNEDDETVGWPRLALLDQRLALRLSPAGPNWVLPAFDGRRVSRQSLLARATGVATNRGLVVLDAMAGWGSDGLELASLGASVTMVESAPEVWSLLRQRITESGITVTALHCADSWSIIEQRAWDVILLDPMFPERGRKGLAKLPMQTLKQVACNDGRPLVEWVAHAVAHARLRVVLKRRRTEAVIGGPAWRIEGRSIRFDVYQGGVGRSEL